MSLILEALRKLERDRHTHERGFLVLAPPAWAPAGERAWTRGAALVGVAALAGGAVAAALLWPGRTPPVVMTAAAPVTLAATTTTLPEARPLPGPVAPAARVAWPGDRVPAPKAATPPVTAVAPPAAARPRERPVVEAPAAAPAEADAPVTEAEEPAPEPAEAPAATPVAGPLRLEAIAQRDGQPVAVVSGQLVRVGDAIGTGTVVRIGVSEIEIETDGRRQILRF